MGRTKKDFINELIETAQDSVWKNELALLYSEKFGTDDKDKELKINSCKHAIEKDKEYIDFLKCELSE